MDEDRRYLQILAVAHYVVAALAALFACLFLIHLALGLSFATAPDRLPRDLPPALIGWFLVAFAGFMLLTGWAFALALAWAGRCLARARRYTFCLVMGGVACVFFPLGTVLGVLTLVVLSRPGVRALFGEPPERSTPAATAVESR